MVGYRLDKLVHRTASRIGAPAVWPSSTSKKLVSMAGSVLISRLRPPFFPGAARVHLGLTVQFAEPQAGGLGISPSTVAIYSTLPCG